MKDRFKKIFLLITLIAGMLLFPLISILFVDPKVSIALWFMAGNMYRKAGETVMTTEGGKPETLTVYKAHGKPFLIVGPCMFHEGGDYEDFFFVNRCQVIRTATDKGGDIWCRAFGLLFMLDDMSDRNDRVRLPFWDDLEHQGASVRYDEATASYVYSLRINRPEQSVSFAIPARLFTSDLLNAPNDTRY